MSFILENQSNLLDVIQGKREKMIQCANEKGFTSEETVQYSQELDQLIFQYQLYQLRQKNGHNPTLQKTTVILQKSLLCVSLI